MRDRQVGLLASLLAIALLAAAPQPAAALRLLGAPFDPTDPTGPLLAVIGLVSWALVGWLALGAALVLASRLPGLAGRLAAGVAARALPAVVRRSLEVALGASLVVGTVGITPAVAATGEPGDRAQASRALPSTADLSLDWPMTDKTPSTPAPAPVADPALAPTPADRTPVTATADRASVVRPVGSAVSPVVVRPGDTLWDLAARELAAAGIARSEAAVAARWPAWWAANRTAIGDDPHLLRPGTALRPPSS